MPDLKPEGFVEGVRKVVRTIRYGPRELTLATFGLLLLVLPAALPKVPDFLKPVLDWLPWAGVLLLAVAAWLIWRKVVAPVPEGKPKPAAIKGPAPFGPNDAELFARLGRKDDLNRLRDWILDDQKPLVALMGESGVGKTSLLRAGLESHLKGDSIQVTYWEALPTAPEEGLLHAVRSRWGDPTTAPATFERLVPSVAGGKRVVVIDQAEQLSPDRHRAVFELLRRVATASPPYAATWVVAFRRDYLPVWREFELGLPEPAQRRLETLPLRRFLPEQAEKVIAVLAEEGGVPIEQEVVKALVQSIEFEGRVTPTDIGISLLVLSEISGTGKDSAFTTVDFRERGGQAGLLMRYLQGLLEQFSEAERREVFQALLSLIDLDNDQRLAEGRTPLELEKAARPANPSRFGATLRFLASGKARVLEEVPEPLLRYRLIHERLIPAIRRLTGVLLAEAAQAGLLLERAYQIWARDRKARYLLSGRELRQVLRFRDQLAWGDEADQKREYLRLARKHRSRLWASATLALISLGLGVYLYTEQRSRVVANRALLNSWELPTDLPDYLQQIEALTLPKGVTQFDWLKKAYRLRSLEIEYANLAGLGGLPEELRSLKVGGSQITESPRLPLRLVSLEVADKYLANLENLPRRLLSLSLRCDPYTLKDSLPTSLENLNLAVTEPMLGPIDLRYLKNLRSLTLSSSDFGQTEIILPEQVRSFTVTGDSELWNWQYITFPDLEHFSCSCRPMRLPQTLRRLDLTFPPIPPDDLNTFAPRLHSLTMRAGSIPKFPLPALVNLEVYIDNFAIVDVREFAPALKNLRINGRALATRLEELPEDLHALELVGNMNAILPSRLPRRLKRLEISHGARASLPQLPEGLTSLTYSGHLQQRLPQSLRSLTILVDPDPPSLAPAWALSQLRLYGRVTRIPRNLDSLVELDISNSEIDSLQGVPPGLISLTLRPGQLKSLRGLPKSVVSLHFRGRDGALY